MPELHRNDLSVRAERAVLIGIPDEEGGGEASVDELARLVEAAGGIPVERVLQRRDAPDPKTYLGKGKVEELAARVRAADADVVVADDDLTPAQGKTLEERTGTKVIDRSELILDIFASRARTREAKDQVELAQLEYVLPRLKRMWTHLSRIEGGIGMRGPGERQIEEDRRVAQRRIADLRERIEKNASRRVREVATRSEAFTACLVGYTNAGKSSLMRRLTGAAVRVRDRLFETLETRTRKLPLPDGTEGLLSDTVGFIRKLPHHLVASFRATLEEARQADLLLHVVDAADPQAQLHTRDACAVLDAIGCADRPTVLVLNKIDLARAGGSVPFFRPGQQDRVEVSAETGEGIDGLIERLARAASSRTPLHEILLPLAAGDLLARVAREGRILDQRVDGDHLVQTVRITEAALARIRAAADGRLEVRPSLPAGGKER